MFHPDFTYDWASRAPADYNYTPDILVGKSKQDRYYQPDAACPTCPPNTPPEKIYSASAVGTMFTARNVIIAGIMFGIILLALYFIGVRK